MARGEEEISLVHGENVVDVLSILDDSPRIQKSITQSGLPNRKTSRQQSH